MTDDTPTEGGIELVSVARLLLDGISVGVLATEILENSKHKLHTWDRFGRYIEVTDADAGDKASKAYALDRLAEYYQALQEASLSPDNDGEAENDIQMMLEDYENPLWTFHWTAKSSPDFETLQANYEIGNTSKPKHLTKAPAQQSHVYKLLKALVHLHYGEEILEDIQLNYSTRLSTIKKDLERLGYNFSSYDYETHLKFRHK